MQRVARDLREDEREQTPESDSERDDKVSLSMICRECVG